VFSRIASFRWRRWRSPELLRALLLCLACLAAYANGLTGTFTYDDKAIVRDNPRIRAPGRIGEIFATSYFGGPRGQGSAYRPVLLASYAVQWWLHGKDALAFHVVNLLLHAGATLLLLRLLGKIGIPPPAAYLSALFFAVAPIHVEAVTSLVGRGETLAAVFVLGFLLSSLSSASAPASVSASTSSAPGPGRPRPVRRVLWLLAALLLYGLGILTKESAAVAPGLLFLLLAASASGGLLARVGAAFRRGWPVYAGGAVVLAATFALRAWVLGGLLRAPGWGIFEVENPLAALTAPRRISNALLLLLRYAGRTVFPLFLSADESAWAIPMRPAVSALGIAAGLLLGVVVALSLVRLRDGSPSPYALGTLFFLVAFLPTANVLYPIGTIFGERVAYLPSAGLCLALGALCAGGASSFGQLRRPAVVAAAAIATLFSVRTVIRNPAWWTDWSIFANSLRTAPESAKAHYNWAYVCAESERREEAHEHYARAAAIYGGYWDAWAGKGRMERELGRLSEAEVSYGRALAAYAGYENGFFGLGLVYEQEDRLADAEALYRRGIAKNPSSLPLAFRLACVLSDRDGPQAETDAAWRRALQLGPDSSATHAEYADWLLDTNRPDEAALEAHRALAKEPGSPTALRVLARRRGDGDASLASALVFEKACRSSRDREDFDELVRIARTNEAYRPRFERVRGDMEKRLKTES
jgi:tetratricopeptide (TPR) repeat protein